MSKLTLQLSPEMDRVLDQLADTRQLPKAQVLRRAMLLMQFLDDQVADDHDIVLRDRRTGETSRLVFESQLSDRVPPTSPQPTTTAPSPAPHANQDEPGNANSTASGEADPETTQQPERATA